MRFMDDLADDIENMGGEISYVGNPRMAGDNWAFEVATLSEKTTLISRYASPSRVHTYTARNDLIGELDARGIEVVEVDRVMLSVIDGLASVALH